MEYNEYLNIPSTISDPCYNYKMPRIQTVTQTSKSGVKTKWSNIREVSSALKVPIEYPLIFIGKELGSNSDIIGNDYLLDGRQKVDQMQQVLDKFIKKYVICPKCKLPEIFNTIFIREDKGEIRCKCRACGSIGVLDSTHEFSNYIKKFPPEDDFKQEYGKKTANTEKQMEAMKLLDEKTINLIKKTIQKIERSLSSTIEDHIKAISDILGENNFNLDVKYYILANALFYKNIYTQQLFQRILIFKSFIAMENENTDEALFYFIIGLSDLIFLREKGEYAKYIPSMLYYFYKEDIITEEFWKIYAVTFKLQKFSTYFYSREREEKFLKAAGEFTAWIASGPYEGDVEIPFLVETISNEEAPESAEFDIDIDYI